LPNAGCNHGKENLANFGYKLDTKIKEYRHLSIFLAIFWNLYGDMVIWKTNS
jgi:hypothetical protein